MSPVPIADGFATDLFGYQCGGRPCRLISVHPLPELVWVDRRGTSVRLRTGLRRERVLSPDDRRLAFAIESDAMKPIFCDGVATGAVSFTFGPPSSRPMVG